MGEAGMTERIRAPELPDSLTWVNCDFAPSIAGSAGKAVVIYFWTYSNINSQDLLPDIRALENKYENGLVVIGIHCPKFPHEEASENVLKAINRLFVRHPVATDNTYSMWQQYGINAWPSLAVIDAEGNLRQIFQGDNCVRQVDRVVTDILNDAANRDQRSFSRVRTERKPEPQTALSFPTAVIAARGMLYIADSANNRILETKENGRVIRSFGSGNPGFWDGTLEHSGFSHPRDLAVSENYVYVADTGNHAIRRINLFNGEVETLVGNGKPGKTVVRNHREMREVALDAPVGLCANGPDLYISMSGMHQIWKLDLKNASIGWFCGNGQAWISDGEPTQAAFAHPMGMAMADPFLYVADADGSAIRELRCPTGQVQTRLGKGVFMFGDEDGSSNRALMQYPMDVAVDAAGKSLWIADSFNDKLRVLDLKSGELSTPEIDYRFHEPFGLCLSEDTLWVANTNAHEIVKVDTRSLRCERVNVVESSF
jgi:DNA-binding beta-propeller fold protein YncE